MLVMLALTRAYILALDENEAKRLFRLIAWSGFAYAIYGVVSTLVDPTRLLWRARLAYVGNLTGTFVNRNTAATYFGTCANVFLVMLLRNFRAYLGSDLSVRDALGLLSRQAPPRTLALAAAGWAVTFGAVVATGSRAGTVLTLASFGVTALLMSSRRHSRILPVGLGILVIAAVALEVFGGVLAGRITARGLGDPARLEVYGDTLQMIAETPLWGTGLGTFEYVFPKYRHNESGVIGVVDRAHSTPLELAAELGIPAVSIVGLAGALVLVRLLLGGLRRRRDRAFSLAAFSVALLGGLHSCVDFSLQIPGYAVVFAAVVGTGLAQSVSRTRFESSRPDINVRTSNEATGSAKT